MDTLLSKDCLNCPAKMMAKMVYDLSQKNLKDQNISHLISAGGCDKIKLLDNTNQKN